MTDHGWPTSGRAGATGGCDDLVASGGVGASTIGSGGGPPGGEPVGPAPAGTPPIACTLEPVALPGRLADWKAMLAGARSRRWTGDGAMRIELGDDVSRDELVALVDAEQRCCAFFSFAVGADDGGLVLEVRAPEEAAAIVAEVFGPAG